MTQIRKKKNPEAFGHVIFKLANLVQNTTLSNKRQGLVNKEVTIEDT